MKHTTQKGRSFEWDTRFEGVINNLERRHKETESSYVRSEIERYMASNPCHDCDGQRLKPHALAVKVGGLNIIDVTSKSIAAALEWTRGLSAPAAGSNGAAESDDGLTEREWAIADRILKEIEARLRFLVDIGLDYLTLERTASTLSGGEAQRIRLATQIGSGLMGVLYVCDEPSVGLHSVDDARLIGTLQRLRDIGNTVIIVEHDEAIMRAADHLIDLGPGAGEHGGHVVATGPPAKVSRDARSITGQYLSGRREIPLPVMRRPGSGSSIVVKGPRANNLKNQDVSLPLGMLVCVTGVSGSGKSTLINEVVYKRLAQQFYKAKDRPGESDGIEGVEAIDKVVNIDQSPIGRTPRSNPATYTGAFTPIRELFATVPEARMRGYKPGRFSFNVKGGRCQACSGDGYNQIEMQFLPDVTVPCEVCKGKRYNREALEIIVQGQEHSRRARHDGLGGYGALRQHPQGPQQDADDVRRRPRLHQARPARDDAVRRRGPARQAVHRAVEARHRQHALHPGRANHRAVLRGLRPPAQGAPPSRRRRKQRHADRAPPRPDQERRLDRRPRPGRGRRRRLRHRRGHARGHRRDRPLPHRPLPPGTPGPRRSR